MIITQLSRPRDNLHIHVIILAKQVRPVLQLFGASFMRKPAKQVRPVLQLQQIHHAHVLHGLLAGFLHPHPLDSGELRIGLQDHSDGWYDFHFGSFHLG